MNKTIKVNSIEININNQTIKVSINDARILYQELQELFGSTTPPIVIPQIIPPSISPTCPYPYPYITC